MRNYLKSNIILVILICVQLALIVILLNQNALKDVNMNKAIRELEKYQNTNESLEDSDTFISDAVNISEEVGINDKQATDKKMLDDKNI